MTWSEAGLSEDKGWKSFKTFLVKDSRSTPFDSAPFDSAVTLLLAAPVDSEHE